MLAGVVSHSLTKFCTVLGNELPNKSIARYLLVGSGGIVAPWNSISSHTVRVTKAWEEGT